MKPTVETRKANLALANEVRAARSVLLRRMYLMDVADSHRFAAELLEDVPEALCSLQVGKFLARIRRRDLPGVRAVQPNSRRASVEIDRVLNVVGLHDMHRLGDLTLRQRSALAAALRFRAEFPKAAIQIEATNG